MNPHLRAYLDSTTSDLVSVPRSWLENDVAQPAQVQGDLTCPEIAARLGRKASTIRSWCAEGRFPGAYRLHNREWRVPPAGLKAFQEAARGGAADLSAWRSR